MKNVKVFVVLFILFLSLSVSANPMAEKQVRPISQSSDNITIGIIPSGSSSPFHQELITGANHAATDAGWQVDIRTPDKEENLSAQKEAMLSMIRQNVTMISLNSLDPAALSSEIEESSRYGIPVFVHNSLTPAPDLNISAYIGYNQFNGAAEMGYYAVRRLAEKHNDAPETVQGQVFILRGLPGFHADQRTAGFVSALSQSPGIRITGEEVAGWDRDVARNVTLEVLKKNPGIEIIYANSDEMAIGAAQAVRERGKEVNKDVFCLGIDGNTPTLEMIRNNTMTATLGVYPDRIGQAVIQAMKKYRQGTLAGPYIETPSVVVDKQNLDAYLNGSAWTGTVTSSPELLHTA